MIFVWGKKVQTRRLGWVGDFCPICRDVRRFALQEVRVVRHFYHIPLNAGESAGWQIECADCGIPLRAKPEDYPAPSPDAFAEGRTLAMSASPGIAALIAKRQTQENDLRMRRLAAAERAELILEPFRLIEPKLAARLARTNIDAKSGAALLTAFLAPVILFQTGIPALEWVGILAIPAGLAATLYLTRTDGRRFFEAILEPMLTRSLGPLEPTVAELSAVVDALKSGGKAVGKYAGAQRLWDRLQSALKGPLGPR